MTAKTVLIVDDEAPIREMIAVALEMADYRVLEADNAQDAHAMVVDHQPDLLLLDWMMPGTSGIELARRLKREEATAELPIIMLTAKGEEDNKIQGLEAGADGDLYINAGTDGAVGGNLSITATTGALPNKLPIPTEIVAATIPTMRAIREP